MTVIDVIHIALVFVVPMVIIYALGVVCDDRFLNFFLKRK